MNAQKTELSKDKFSFKILVPSLDGICMTSLLLGVFRYILIIGPIHVKGKLDTAAEAKLKTDIKSLNCQLHYGYVFT